MTWKYFKKSEFRCKCGCGSEDIDESFVSRLDQARGLAGVPFKVNSGCRCPKHNKAVGGRPGSSHVCDISRKSKAADIAVNTSRERFLIVKSLLEAGFNRIGIADTFVHADSDETKPEDVIWKY